MIWHNGSLLAGSSVTLDASDRGLLLGDGLFDTVAVFNRTGFRLGEHWDRMADGAARLGIPLDRATLDRAASALIEASTDDHGVLRVTVTRGAGPRGLAPPRDALPTIFGTLAPWKADMAFRSISLATSSIRRNSFSPLSRIKSLAYLDNVLAVKEAIERGADDALLLNQAGAVACSSAGNIFVVRGSRLLTPPVQDGILPGIMRGLVLGLARKIGLSVAESSVSPQQLLDADAVFVTNSVRLLDRIIRLDGAGLATAESDAPLALVREIAGKIEHETGFALSFGC